MSEPLVLVVLFATNPDPTAEPLLGAVKKGLGDAVVLTDWSDTPPETDHEALAIGERVHSGAIVRVIWADDSFLRARLHVHVGSSTRWEDEEIEFRPRDAIPERGRTLGYALASMVQRMTRAQPPLPVNADADGEVEAESMLPPAPEPTPEPMQKRAVPPPELAPSAAARTDLVAFGTGVLGGGATSGGAGAALRWWPRTWLGLRGAAGARVGDVAEAQASTMTLFGAAGLGYRLVVHRSVELGARSDLLVLQHAVKRSDALGTTRVRWIGAADLMLEASWSFAAQAGLVAAVGGELAFGTTPIRVAGREVADIPPARAVSELGLRVRF